MHVQRTILEEPRQQNAPADPICSPSRFALSPSHKSPVQQQQWRWQRVNDSLCFVAGTRTKANDNNKSIKLSGSEHISTFLRPTRGLKCTYCTPAPQAAGGPETPGPSVARENLINDWSKLLCHQQGTTPTTAAATTVSYIILTALFFSCLPLSIQRPVIGVTLCTG